MILQQSWKESTHNNEDEINSLPNIPAHSATHVTVNNNPGAKDRSVLFVASHANSAFEMEVARRDNKYDSSAENTN